MVIQIKMLSTVEENCTLKQAVLHTWKCSSQTLLYSEGRFFADILQAQSSEKRPLFSQPDQVGANQVRSSFMYLLVQVCAFNMYTGKRKRTHQGVFMWIKMLRQMSNCCAGLRDQHRKECIQRRSMRLVYRKRILPCKPFILQSVSVHCFFHNDQNIVNHLSKIQWCHTMRPLIMLCSGKKWRASIS